MPVPHALLKRLFLFPVNNPKKWIAWRSVLVATPVALLAFLKAEGPPDPESLHSQLKAMCSTSPWISLILPVMSVVISVSLDLCEHFSRWIKEQSSDYRPSVELARTLAALNMVVGYKSERLGKALKLLQASSSGGAVDIHSLVPPNAQMEELIKQLWNVLTGLTASQNFKIILASVDLDENLDYLAYMPDGERPQVDLLTEDSSFIRYILKSGTEQCIPNIESHLKQAAQTTKTRKKKLHKVSYCPTIGGPNKGSIWGFPIFDSHLNRRVLVITIKHARPDFIHERFCSDYASLIEPFKTRLLLENRIRLLHAYGNTI